MKPNKAILKGSLILLIVFNLYALLNFIFQSAMARMLSPADYGLLAFLFYFVYLTNIFSESIQTIIAKYSSSEKNNGALRNILKRGVKKSIRYASISFIIYLPIALIFSYFIDAPKFIFLVNGLAVFASFLLPIPRGIMQGRKKFYSLGFNLIIESFVKLVLAVFLVWAGWKVYGAIGALLAGWAAAFFISFLFIREIVKSREKRINFRGFYNYSIPVFIASASILAFYTIDLFIAQIVFSKELAGYYAIASVLSKTIFWGTQPISKAMFPLSAGEKNGTRNRESMYFTSLVLLASIIIIALLLFYFFPGLIIRVFAGRFIAESSVVLFYLCLSTSLLSIANLNILYSASKGNLKNSWLLPVLLLIGASFMFIFSNSLVQFALAFLVSSSLFLWISLFFLPLGSSGKKQKSLNTP